MTTCSNGLCDGSGYFTNLSPGHYTVEHECQPCLDAIWGPSPTERLTLYTLPTPERHGQAYRVGGPCIVRGSTMREIHLASGESCSFAALYIDHEHNLAWHPYERSNTSE